MHVVLVASGDLAAGSVPPLKRPHRDLAHGVPPTPTDRPAATARPVRRGVAVVVDVDIDARSAAQKSTQ